MFFLLPSHGIGSLVDYKHQRLQDYLPSSIDWEIVKSPEQLVTLQSPLGLVCSPNQGLGGWLQNLIFSM